MIEKKKGKRQEEGRKQGVERGGDDASCHEVSLVTAVTEKATDNRDYNYSFQHWVWPADLGFFTYSRAWPRDLQVFE